MTPLYLAVVPRRSGWDQLVLHAGVLQSNVKRTEFRIADILVCKLRPVIRLDCLNLERKYFLKHFEELHRVFRCMLLKPVNKSYSGAFVYGCPLGISAFRPVLLRLSGSYCAVFTTAWRLYASCVILFMRSYLFVAFWWFVVILLYHFEIYFSSFFGSYHFSTDRKFVLERFLF